MNQKTTRERIVFAVVFVIFLLYSVSLLFPFVWTVYSSFKQNGLFKSDIWGLPKTFYVENYTYIFENYNIPAMFLNSGILTVGGVFLSLMFSSMAAYTVSKYKFRIRNFIYVLALVALVVPQLGSLPSQFKFMTSTGLIDTYTGVLLMYAGAFGGNFILMYSFFKNISWSYAESAFIDGANDFDVFFRIMLPLAKGGMAAVALIQGIGLWNDYFTPYVFLPSKPTLSVGLNEMSSLASAFGKYTQLFAAIVVVTAPVLVVFICFERVIMENTIAGGIKG